MPDQAESFVETLKIDKAHGIGHVTAEKMKQLGIHTGTDLKARSEAELVQHFGKSGHHYFKIARGQDDAFGTGNLLAQCSRTEFVNRWEPKLRSLKI